MYCSHFGLHRPAFNNTPDPSFYYSTPEHEEALATLQYATQQRKGFVLVTGEVGAGKTLIGRVFLRQIGTEAKTAVITQTNLSGQQLLEALCVEFELDPPLNASKLELSQLLQDYLLDQFARDHFVVVLLDEAQNLPDESFEDLRMLGNLEADDAKLLQVCILGQPELRDRFAQPTMKQLEQRLFRRFHLSALSQERTSEYVRHRLKLAGCTNDQLFTPEALEEVYEVSGGIPRLINHVCDNALLAGYAQNIQTIDETIIASVTDRAPAPIEAPDPAPVQKPASPPPGVSHEATDKRIDEIYRSRLAVVGPEVGTPRADALQSAQLAEAAFGQTRNIQEQLDKVSESATSARRNIQKVARRQKQLRAIVGNAKQGWDSAKKKIENYRQEIQSAIGELSSRCRSAEERLDDMTRSTTSTDGLDEIRHMHLDETKRVLGEIAKHRTDFQQLLDQAEVRWSDVHQRMSQLSETAATRDTLTELNAEHERQVRDVLSRIDEHRTQITGLIETVSRRCDQTQESLAQWRQSQARAEAQMVRQLEAKAAREEVEALQKATEQAQARLADQVDAALAETREDIDEQLETKADRQEVHALRESEAQARDKIMEKINAEMAGAQTDLARRLDQAAASQDVDRLREQHQAAIDRIASELKNRQEEINALDQQVTSRFMATGELLREIEKSSATTEALERLRGEHGQAMSDIVQQFSEKISILKEFSQSIAEGAREANAEHKANFKELSKRVIEQARQLQDLRHKLLTDHAATQKAFRELAEQVVSRSDLEALRQEQTEQTRDILDRVQGDREDLLGRIQENQGATQALLDGLLDRYRSTQSQIEAVASSKADADAFARFQTKQAEDVAQVLQLLDDQRRNMQEQFEQSLSCWVQTQENLESLSETAAQASVVKEVREQQANDTRQILATVASHRRDLESLVDQVDQRCTALVQRFNELPADVVDAEQLAAVRAEYVDQIRNVSAQIEARKASFEKAVQSIIQRCAKTQKAVDDLAARSASTREVNELREQQAQRVSHLADRLESRISDQQEKVTGLDRRYEALSGSLQELASTTTPASAFKAAEQALTQNVESLAEKVEQVNNRQARNLNAVAAKTQETARRVTALEEEGRPEPIQLELTPQAGVALAELVVSARNERERLEQNLNQLRQVAAETKDLSSQIDTVMRKWEDGAGDVGQQSEQLRSSAKMAIEILAKMQQFHARIDEKLNSEQWQDELTRGENLASRLEQVVQAAQAASHQLTDRMTELKAEQARFEREYRAEQAKLNRKRTADRVEFERKLRLERAESHRKLEAEQVEFERQMEKRKRLLTTVARSTRNLVEAIASARDIDDERSMSQKSTDVARSSRQDEAAPVNWPSFRTHRPQTQAV